MQLIVLDGSASQPKYDIDALSIVIGRAPDCDVVLNDHECSRHHARISQVQGQWVIEDVQAVNPTVLNDRLLSRARPLHHGDLIVIGAVLLQVAIAESPASGGDLAERTAPPDAGVRERPAAPEETPATRAIAELEPDSEPERLGAPESPPAPAAATVRELAVRLSSASALLEEATDRLDAEASAAALRRARVAKASAELEGVLTAHANLGGEAELGRLSRLLGMPQANQTDLAVLHALGREAGPLSRAARLVQRSLGLGRQLSQALEGDQPRSTRIEE